MTRHQNVAARVDKVLADAVGRDLTSKERNEFLPNIRKQTWLTAPQETWLEEIEARLEAGDDDEKRSSHNEVATDNYAVRKLGPQCNSHGHDAGLRFPK